MHRKRFGLTAATLVAASGALALFGLAACGGGERDGQTGDAEQGVTGPGSDVAASTPAAGADSSAPAPTETAMNDDTPQGALETYLSRCKAGDMAGAVMVCLDGEPGTEKLFDIGEGWEKARSEGAPIGMAVGLIAADIEALSYDQISETDDSAVFEFTSPNKEEPWTIEVVRTVDGWRVKPPPGGLPTG